MAIAIYVISTFHLALREVYVIKTSRMKSVVPMMNTKVKSLERSLV